VHHSPEARPKFDANHRIENQGKFARSALEITRPRESPIVYWNVSRSRRERPPPALVVISHHVSGFWIATRSVFLRLGIMAAVRRRRRTLARFQFRELMRRRRFSNLQVSQNGTGIASVVIRDKRLFASCIDNAVILIIKCRTADELEMTCGVMMLA